MCPDLATRAALNASVAVTITYNSGMDADVNKYDADPEFGLALRMLYSALVRDDSESYSFYHFWLGWNRSCAALPMHLHLQVAIDACILAFTELAPHRTGILLLVDETRKLAEAFERKTGRSVHDTVNGVHDMLGALGRALDSNRPSAFNAACTTLDSLMLQAVATNSGRRIDWVGLDGLHQSSAETMIMHALGRRSAGRVPALLALCIADCARHPRTLESLLEALLSQDAVRKGFPEWLYDPGTLQLIRQMVSSRLVSKSPLWAIRAALNGVTLRYDGIIEGSGGVTFGDAIAKGVFLNTIETKNDEGGVPRLSYMHLLNAASTFPATVCNAILGMAAQEESALKNHRNSSESPFGGVCFEGFVLRWLQLRFGLAAAVGNSQGLSLRELFGLTMDSDVNCDVDSVLALRTTTGSPMCPEQCWHIALPGARFVDAVADQKSRDRICKLIAGGGGTVSFIANNPAFDILLLVHEAAVGMGVGGAAAVAPPPLAIAIEARFSSPTSKLRTTADDIISKERLFREQLDGGAFAALGIPADRVMYVIMASRQDQYLDPLALLAHRGLSADEKATFFAKGVVVLDRAGVARALTPTLVDRAFFFLQPRGFETAPPST